MKVYIIANVPNIDHKKLAKEIENADLLVLMNKAIPMKVKEVKEHPNKHLWLRWSGYASKGYYGEREWKRRAVDPYKEVQYIAGPRPTTLDLSPLGRVYPAGKTPTTGFICYSIYFAHEPTLVNFIARQDRSKIHWGGHAWGWEQTFYKKNKVKMVNCLI